MAEDFQMKETQSVPMDHKRAVEGERLTYEHDKPLDEQSDKRFNIKTGFTTETVVPTYGLVREKTWR